MNKRLGVVGLGAIGRFVVKAADDGKIPFNVSVVASRTKEKAEAFLRTLKNPPVLTDLRGVAEASDMILEASGGPTVEAICRACFPLGKDVILISVGALLERENLIDLARENGCRIYIPSGAIVGLDGLKGAAAGEVESVTMTSRKPPRALKGAPFVEENHIDLDSIREPTVIFEGSPIEACKGFPANLNVSAAVSFAGIGPQRTRLRVMCDPTAERNIHEVEAVGAFGRMFFRIENIPSENPRTGILTYLSTMAFLRQQTSTLVVGT